MSKEVEKDVLKAEILAELKGSIGARREPPSWRRKFRVLLVAFFLLGTGVLIGQSASSYHSFRNGEILEAGNLNDNFGALFTKAELLKTELMSLDAELANQKLRITAQELSLNGIQSQVNAFPAWKRSGSTALYSGPVNVQSLSGAWDQSGSGYVDLGNLRIQWGRKGITVNQDDPSAVPYIAFPEPFKNTTYSITVSPHNRIEGGGGVGNYDVLLSLVMLTGKSVNGVSAHFVDTYSWRNMPYTRGFAVDWIAIGLKP